MTFETAAKEHIASRGSKETRGIYTADLARWLTFCELEGVSPDAPPFTTAVKFRDQLNVKFAALTVRRILAALSAMYDAAGLVNHFRSGKRLHRPEADEVAMTPAYSEEETMAIFKVVAKHPQDAAIIQILYDTGLRISEVVAIQRDSLRYVDGKLFLVAKVKKKGRVESALPPSSARAIEQWLEVAPASPYLFPGKVAGTHLSRRGFASRLTEIGRLAEVKNTHPHRFRATFITTALTAGMSLHEVQAAVHHSDPKTTLRYDRGVRGTGVTAAVASFRQNKREEK
jgi:integrase